MWYLDQGGVELMGRWEDQELPQEEGKTQEAGAWRLQATELAWSKDQSKHSLSCYGAAPEATPYQPKLTGFGPEADR